MTQDLDAALPEPTWPDGILQDNLAGKRSTPPIKSAPPAAKRCRRQLSVAVRLSEGWEPVGCSCRPIEWNPSPVRNCG